MQSGSAMETRRRDGVNMCPHEILLRSNVLMFRWFDRTFIAQLLASLLCDQRDDGTVRGQQTLEAWRPAESRTAAWSLSRIVSRTFPRRAHHKCANSKSRRLGRMHGTEHRDYSRDVVRQKLARGTALPKRLEREQCIGGPGSEASQTN